MTQHLLKYRYLIEAHAQSFQGVFFRSLNKQLQGFASKVFLFLLNDKEPFKKSYLKPEKSRHFHFVAVTCLIILQFSHRVPHRYARVTKMHQ